MLCLTCKQPIPEARLQVLPNTKYCVMHSTEQPRRGFVEGTIKGKSFEVVILEANDPTTDYWEERQLKY